MVSFLSWRSCMGPRSNTNTGELCLKVRHCVHIVTPACNHSVSKMIKNTFHLAGMGLLYVPEKKVTVAEILSKQLDQRFLTKVRAGEMFCFEIVMAALLKSGSKRSWNICWWKQAQHDFFFFYPPFFFLCQICMDAKAEHNMEQTFQKMQQKWVARLFQLEKQRFEPQCGLTETVSDRQTGSQHSCSDAGFTITGRTE